MVHIHYKHLSIITFAFLFYSLLFAFTSPHVASLTAWRHCHYHIILPNKRGHIYHQCLAAVNHLTNVLQSWENMRFFNTIQKKHQPNPLEIAILNSPTQPAIQLSFMQQYNQLFFSNLDKVIEPNTNALAQLKLSMRLDHMEQTLPAFYGNQDQEILREEYTTFLKCNHLKRTIPFS